MHNLYPSIRDELEAACIRIEEKGCAVIDCIKLSYDALDSLIATDSRMRHMSFGHIEWCGIKLDPMDCFSKSGIQYRIITKNKESTMLPKGDA